MRQPPADLNGWYANALLGPTSSCSTGSFPGGFDNDASLNVSLGEVDLTPASAYDCRKLDGAGNTVARLAWQPGSPGTLTIQGTIYFDGDLTWRNLNLIQYDGRATIYASGQVRIANRADLCGAPACDETWGPDVDLLVFVAGSRLAVGSSTLGGDVGNHVNFQGAMYIVNDFEMDNNTSILGARDHAQRDDLELRVHPYASEADQRVRARHADGHPDLRARRSRSGELLGIARP